jgi:LPXTG-site transpeptidase (sortase) family protein
MQSKVLSKRTLLTFFTATLIGLVLFPVHIFASSSIFTRTLRVGMSGEDVRELQKLLNTDTETRVASVGVGSAGNETDYFGFATKRALIKFQEKYYTEVLTPLGLTSGTGILGTKTREKMGALFVATHSAFIVEKIAATTNQEQTRFELPTLPVGRPVRLKIPSINVDAPVEYVGLTSDGAMDVPKGPVKVAWFNLGPRPGENGSAVIAGHYDWKNNIPAVFDNLHKLSKGDKIYIKDEKGATATFVVREIQIYGKNNDASSVFGSSDGKSHLNLITCTGVWNKSEKTFSDRLIVFADRE